ncbi:GNAT family N-acetyltransferase [Rufibacter immobilis]|uniref:GNAT family N-acetyltransferase n=1 Tax=Rufibacter immobilis TaxID=1348778 RepID=UPI0035E75F1C
MQNVGIRVYKVVDKPLVLHLLRLNTPTYFAPEEEKDLLHYLAHEVEEYYVLECDGEVVGCGGVNYDQNRTIGKISWDILHPEHQGKGLGSLLLLYRIKNLREQPQIKQITVRTSQLVYLFYEKHGFQLRQITRDYWSPGFDLYHMEYEGAL